MIKVSVIIPVFKVEIFARKCAESLLNQTLQDVEYIFVDDASPDASISIIEDVISKHPAVNARIISHEVNKGLPSARNTGLMAAKGEFIFHCDGDDWVEEDMLEKLYVAAKENDADIVYCDFYLSFEKNERYMSNPKFTSAEAYLKRGLLGGTMKYNVWNKLTKRSLYTDNDILFPDGHPMGEDMTMIKVAACAKRVTYVPEAFYHYIRVNTNAYSQTQSAKQLSDIRYNVDDTIHFLTKRFGTDLEREISFFKLGIKLPFIISSSTDQYRLWCEWYPEADAYAFDNPDLPLRTRCLQWLASKRIWLGVKIYYFLIYKFVYGILYR